MKLKLITAFSLLSLTACTFDLGGVVVDFSVTPKASPAPSPSPTGAPVVVTPTETPSATPSASTSPQASPSASAKPVAGAAWEMCPKWTRNEGDPELPRVCIDTTPVKSTRLVTVNPGDAADLQAKINAAVPGDELILQAGSTYSGNFVLPSKTGAGWITIRTSDLDGIPPQQNRVIPDKHAASMAKILTPNTQPAFVTQYGAHNYRLIGLDIGVAPGVASTTLPGHTVVTNLVLMGDFSETSVDQFAHDLIIDRCWLHGNKNTNMRRAVLLSAGQAAVVDSHLSDAHEIGADAQAIGEGTGSGPFKIVNNYLEGSTENVMFGGTDPKIDGMVAADIEVRQNYMTKPLNWKQDDPSFTGNLWAIKNVFELKNARRVLVDGNVFERSWIMGQTGYGILFTVRNQDGTCPFCVVEDVTFTNNIIRQVGGGFNILGMDTNHPSAPTKRIKIANNLLDEVGAPYAGTGWAFVISTKGLDGLAINHNTFKQPGQFISFGNWSTALNGPEGQALNLVVRNNVMPHNDYGIFGDNSGVGNPAITTYAPTAKFEKNAFIRTKPGVPGPNQYPGATLFPNISGASFVLYDSWDQVNLAGTDGKPVGADMTVLDAMKAKAIGQ